MAIDMPLTAEHRKVVLHVADGGDRVGRNAQAPGHGLTKVPLSQPGGVMSR